jgi:hypothetical protein
MKSIILSLSLKSVVQVIPTGLLKAKNTFFAFFPIGLPSIKILSVSSTLSPVSAPLPLTLTLPSRINLSAPLLEQKPVSLIYLLIRFNAILIKQIDDISIYRKVMRGVELKAHFPVGALFSIFTVAVFYFIVDKLSIFLRKKRVLNHQDLYSK